MMRSWPEFVAQCKRFAWWFSKGLVIKFTLYEGKLQGSDAVFRCWVVGDSKFPIDFRSRIYEAEPRVVHVVRLPFFCIGRFLRSKEHSYDLFIGTLPIHRSNVLDADSSYTGPTMITQGIDTSGGWDGIAANMARAKRNWVNRFRAQPDLEFEISHSPEDLRFFYDRMLIPYVKTRFGALGDYDHFGRMEKMLGLGGFLMFVRKQGQRIAATLCQMDTRMLAYNRVGLLDGDERLLETGALMAIYYGQVQIAVDHKLPLLDLKQSRPFLMDGVFQNKARWGARVTRYGDAWTQAHYRFAKPTAGLARALELCPLIVFDKQDMRALIGYTASPEPTEVELKKLLTQYYLRGLKSVTVMTAQRTYDMAA